MDKHVDNATVLIVDDEETNVFLMETILEAAGFTDVHSTTDSRHALALFSELQPDIVLLDLQMPFLDGFDVMALIRQTVGSDDILPILVLTANVSSVTKRSALAQGATDYVTKPFDADEVVQRVRNLIRLRLQHLDIASHAAELEARVLERTRELERAQLEVLDRLAKAAEYRDDDTGEHTKRVGEMAELIAIEMGLSKDLSGMIRQAGQLHDLGKTSVPDTILLKPGRLTSGEYDEMKEHTRRGADILSCGRSAIIQLAEQIALNHHERWDGKGYPNGLSGDQIPTPARIIAVADVFDALTHTRPYKEAWPVERAIEEIRQNSGSQFDPTVVDAFLQVMAREAADQDDYQRLAA